MNNKLEVLVEYESPKIKKAIIKCPSCKKYFTQEDALEYKLVDKQDVDSLFTNIKNYENKFVCPICGHIIVGKDNLNVVVQETNNFPKVMRKVVSWEE